MQKLCHYIVQDSISVYPVLIRLPLSQFGEHALSITSYIFLTMTGCMPISNYDRDHVCGFS
jgi:hypothetical protein